MTRYNKLMLVRQAERMLPFLKNTGSKGLKMVFVLLCAPVSLVFLLLARGRMIVPYMELVVTERCSLKCLHCANLMQYYCNPQHLPLQDVRADFAALRSKVRAIWVIQLLGGEPFLYPDLVPLLKELTAEPKVKRIQVVTNGTLLPKEPVLEALRHKKVTVHISNYGAQSRNLDALVALLKARGIRYKLLNYSEWMDYGGLEKRHLSHETLLQSFRECAAAECKTLIGGMLYTCPRSAHMARLGLLPRELDAVDVYDAQDFDSRLREFYNVDTIHACDHCNPVWDRKPIAPGEQVRGNAPCLPVNMEE